MSKKKNISYLFGLAFLLLAGCDTDTATVPLPDDGERAVEVRLRASVCTVETTVGRSVIEGTALNTGDEIGIFLMRDSNFSTPYLQNLPYRYAEGGQLSLQPEGTKVYYPARQDTLYLYGYYPYTETAAADENGRLHETSGWTEIFIYPGYQFKVIDALITNFHLPQSTLVMLVSALAGRAHVLHAYEIAVKERYRFFSFGDAMLIK